MNMLSGMRLIHVSEKKFSTNIKIKNANNLNLLNEDYKILLTYILIFNYLNRISI